RLRIAPVSTTVTLSLCPDWASNRACVSAMTSRMPFAEITLISAASAAMSATTRSIAAIAVLIMLLGLYSGFPDDPRVVLSQTLHEVGDRRAAQPDREQALLREPRLHLGRLERRVEPPG